MVDHAVLFLGPTLPADAARAMLELEVRPPARRGDVYRAAMEGPRAILLVDGVFENEPAVLQKEVLWALSQGVHVFGASSMGALRAAELTAFGMVGVGEVFAAFADGRIERDDEVAVLHAPAELGYSPLTRALVDVRAAVGDAERRGVVDRDMAVRLVAAASSLFWKERTFERIAGEVGDGANPFLAFTAQNETSQKRADAETLLAHVASVWDALEEPFAATFRFEETSFWQTLVAGWDAERWQQGRTEARWPEDVLRDAILILAAEEILTSTGAPFDDVAFQTAAASFRATHGLVHAADVVAWLAAGGFSHADYVAFVRDHHAVQALRDRHRKRSAGTAARVARLRSSVDR